MRLTTYVHVFAAAALPLAPSLARADSDGYYCVGPDYIAYQFGLAAPPVASHRLHVIRLTREGLGADTLRLDLPQFQVHGMRCEARSVTVAAFDAVYTITLDDNRRPLKYTKTASSAHRATFRPGRDFDNLGGMGYRRDYKEWGKTVRRPLANQRSSGTFVLEFVPDPVKPDECRAQVTTTLLLLDEPGNVLASRRVFRGPASRECGDDFLPAMHRSDEALKLSTLPPEAEAMLRAS